MFISSKSDHKSFYSILRLVAGFASFSSSSLTFPIALLPVRRHRSTPTNWDLTFLSVTQWLCIAEREAELCRASCPDESHSSFHLPLTSIEFLAAATNFSSFTANSPDRAAYPILKHLPCYPSIGMTLKKPRKRACQKGRNSSQHHLRQHDTSSRNYPFSLPLLFLGYNGCPDTHFFRKMIRPMSLPDEVRCSSYLQSHVDSPLTSHVHCSIFADWRRTVSSKFLNTQVPSVSTDELVLPCHACSVLSRSSLQRTWPSVKLFTSLKSAELKILPATPAVIRSRTPFN